MTRHFQILISENMPSNLPANTLIINEFSKIQNLLGQEFEAILFDARKGIHLEALAIAAGTLKMNGALIVLLSNWEKLHSQIDEDSLRWSGSLEAITTPRFIAYFKHCIHKYGFPVLYHQNDLKFDRTFQREFVNHNATLDQQKIIEQILQKESELYFLTAKRGRGKSALAGLLANQLDTKIYLTAPNKSAVKILAEFSQKEIIFIAPDALFLALQNDPSFSENAWLFVDEAAMLPIAQLTAFSHHFKHILFTTTIHSYEGTGRGFELKFKQKINRTFSNFELIEPLRWSKDDALEAFIDELLLLNVEDEFKQTAYDKSKFCQIAERSQEEILSSLSQFYGLMTLAHYRTSPLDLRRLFDANAQRFFTAENKQDLLGAVWVLKEGGIEDAALIEAIQQGTRRPKGNLVPQALCFHAQLQKACELHSLRISRIAVQPMWQQHGIGTQLIEYITQNADLDYLSVSFGYTKELAQFWQKCGFSLVHLGEHLETSSGCYSAIALKGLSAQGIELEKEATQSFQRNMPLSFHPLVQEFNSTSVDWELIDEDWLSLKNFAYFHRTLASALPAIRRFLMNLDEKDCPLMRDYFITKQIPYNKKNGLKLLRSEIAQKLKKEAK